MTEIGTWASCLLAVELLAIASNFDGEIAHDLARVLRRFLLSRRTLFFLHFALILQKGQSMPEWESCGTYLMIRCGDEEVVEE